MTQIALVCGEASGDQLGAGLALALQQQAPGIDLVGVTGPAMRAVGVRSWLDCHSFAAMGYAEVLRRLPSLWRARQTVRAALAHASPCVFVGIDAPDLNLDLGARARAAGSHYVQYVCPQFWAWRPQRATHLARDCAKVLALLPFEVAKCKQQEIKAVFVGHRLADEVPLDPARRQRARAQLGIAADAQVLALLPGSRRQELAGHAKLFGDVGRACQAKLPQLQCWAAPLRATAGACGAGVHECPGAARTVLAAADAALVKSGTITLEAALLDCPQVVAYRLGALAEALVHWRLGDLHARTYSLPNLVTGDKFLAEFVQERTTVPTLMTATLKLFEPAHAAQLRTGYAKVRAALAVGADMRAARAVLEVLGA